MEESILAITQQRILPLLKEKECATSFYNKFPAFYDSPGAGLDVNNTSQNGLCVQSTMIAKCTLVKTNNLIKQFE